MRCNCSLQDRIGIRLTQEDAIRFIANPRASRPARTDLPPYWRVPLLNRGQRVVCELSEDQHSKDREAHDEGHRRRCRISRQPGLHSEKHRTDYDAAVRELDGRARSASTGRSITSMWSPPATIVPLCTSSKRTEQRRFAPSRNCRHASNRVANFLTTLAHDGVTV